MKKTLSVFFALLFFATPAWAASNQPLGSLPTVTSPQRGGDATTGLYTAGAGSVDVAISGTKKAEFTAAGEDFSGANGSLTLPIGTSAQRPGTPAAGMLRYNSTSSGVEAYYGSAWNTVNSAASFSGNLPVTNLNSGTNAAAGTYWSGAGSWTPPGMDTCTDVTGSTTVYVCTSVNGQATTNGKIFAFKPQTTNTASSTLTINGVIWTLKKQGNNLAAGDLIGGQWYTVISDGVFWDVTSRLGTDGSGGGSVSVTAATPDIVITPSPGTGTFTVGSISLFNEQIGTSYAIVASDMGKTVTMNNASAVAVTIAQAGTTGFALGTSTNLVNLGVGTVTLTPTISTINGASTLTLAQGQSAYIGSDGSNYIASLGKSSGSGSTTNQTFRSITYVIDGGGSAITTGVKGTLIVPFACTINSATLIADQSGSIVVDIWKKAFAGTLPTVTNTITASALPTLSSAVTAQDTTLTGWTTSVSANDMITYNVNSASTVTRIIIALKCTAS